jgi:hypothetical protein
MPVQITQHAIDRWAERFPGRDIYAEYARARRVGRKTKRRIREACAVSYLRWHTGVYKGRVLRMTRDGIVFVVAMQKDVDDVIITVYPLPMPM